MPLSKAVLVLGSPVAQTIPKAPFLTLLLISPLSYGRSGEHFLFHSVAEQVISTPVEHVFGAWRVSTDFSGFHVLVAGVGGKRKGRLETVRDTLTPKVPLSVYNFGHNWSSVSNGDK